jgi:hypothetical protein
MYSLGFLILLPFPFVTFAIATTLTAVRNSPSQSLYSPSDGRYRGDPLRDVQSIGDLV